MRYLMFVVLFFSCNSYSAPDVWILRSDKTSCANSPRSYGSFSGCDWNMPPYHYLINRIERRNDSDLLYYENEEGDIAGSTTVSINRLWEGCPSGTQMIDGICQEPSSEPNYCETPEAQRAMDSAVQACVASANENQTVVTNTASCNHDTGAIETECVINDVSTPDPGGDGGENPPSGGGDGDGGENPPSGGGDGDGGENPPSGGGDGDGGENPPSGGGDGGDNPPIGDTDLPDFCRDNPDVCLYPPDDPACYDDPSLCDVPENDDLLATIRQVTEAVKDQHFNTDTVIKTNTLNTANNTNDLLTVADANHDQLNKISSNTNSIANNTSNANALIKNNTAKIVGAIEDIEGNDYSGQLSAIKSELTQMGNELQKGFCDKNPNHESCVEKKADSSSCEKFVCTGEPVLCILLEVEHQKKCLLPDFGSLEESLGDLVSQGDPSNLLQGDVLDFSNPDAKYLNGEGVNLNGFCPSSDVIDVLDGSLEISYRPLCDLAIMLNPLIIAMGWVVAARNVGRGISNL